MTNTAPIPGVAVEKARRDSIVREIETISQVDFPSPAEGGEGSHAPQDTSWMAHLWLLWGRRSLILKVAGRALVISTVVALLIPSRYESTVKIMPPDQADAGALLALLAGKVGGGGGGGGGGLASVAGGFLGMKTPGALFVDLARSRTVQDAMIDRFQLQKIYGTSYKQDARKVLDKRTDIEEDRKSGVISITVSDNNKQRTQALADAYVQELDRLVSQVSTSSARRERVFIEQRLSAVKSDLEDAEKQFSEFASKNTALDIKEQAKAEVEAASVLQGQLIAAQSELQGLEQIYTESNVRVRSLRARIAELKSQLQNVSGTDASLASSGSPPPDDPYPSIRRLPLLGVRWADLYRRVKIQETVYELLNQQYELTRIQEAKEIPTVRVIDPAALPEKKSWPPRLLIVMFLTSVAVIGAMAYVVTVYHWEGMNPDDERKIFTLRVWQSVRERAARLAAFLHLERLRLLRKDRD